MNLPGLEIYRKMLTIRLFEDMIAECCLDKKFPGPAHLYTGQEAAAVGVCQNLNKEDYVFSTHRAHGHFIAKGGDLNALAAEIFCRETGCSRGRGGSMHLVSPDIGIMGTSAIVAGTIPLGVGAALASEVQKKKWISVIFFGDGASDEGTFHESLNFAAHRKLPVLFACENNYYSTHLHIDFRQPKQEISRFAVAQGVTVIKADGNDALDTYEKAKQAVEIVRKERKPVFLEMFVNRWRGHVGPNWDYDVGLRTKEQVEAWKQDDPIKKFGEYLIENNLAKQEDLDEIKKDVEKEIEAAREFAEASPKPPTEEVDKYVFRGKK